MKLKIKTEKFSRLLKGIASVLLVFVFLFPSIVKLDHHHEHFECNAKNNKHFHVQHKKCGICSFEFSLFKSSPHLIFRFENVKMYDNYINLYDFNFISDCFKYSFSLRAPPRT